MNDKNQTGLRDIEQMLDDVLGQLRASGIEASAKQAAQIAARMREMLDYTPKVGVLGKTGVGKSSLCNALFGREVAAVSHVRAGTREAGEYVLPLGKEGAGLVLVDVPGVGESEERDAEYAALYRTLIPQLDVLIWVVKADDRAFTIEERFHRDVVRPVLGQVPLLVAVNQADKIDPVREWDIDGRRPGPKQAEHLSTKRHVVRESFGISYGRIVCVSAVETFGLGDLLTAVVEAVPRSKRVGVVREASEAAQTEEAKKSAEKGFWAEVWEKTKAVVAAVGGAVAAEAVAALATKAGAALLRLFR